MNFIDKSITNSLNEILILRGINVQNKESSSAEDILQIFSAITIFYGIVTYENTDSNNKEDINTFKDNLTDVLINGLGRKKNPILPSRRKQIEEFCKIDLDETTESDRFFNAFVTLFDKYKINEITVEKLANELNIAKSSLYSFFSNKYDLIEKMLYKEVNLAAATLVEKVILADNTDEMIYILLRTESNYLRNRPNLIMLHSWLVQQGIFLGEGILKTTFFGFPEKIFPSNFNLGVQDNKKAFLGWISCLSVIFTMHNVYCLKETCTEQWRDLCLKNIFKYVECGIIGCEKVGNDTEKKSA